MDVFLLCGSFVIIVTVLELVTYVVDLTLSSLLRGKHPALCRRVEQVGSSFKAGGVRLESCPGQDYPDRNLVVLLSSSSKMPRYYLKQAMASSLHILSSSLFIEHGSLVVRLQICIMKLHVSHLRRVPCYPD
jgi:hypothetical protein